MPAFCDTQSLMRTALSVFSAFSAIRMLAHALGGRCCVALLPPPVGHVPYDVHTSLRSGLFVEVWEPLMSVHCMVFGIGAVVCVPGTNPVVMGVAW